MIQFDPYESPNNFPSFKKIQNQNDFYLRVSSSVIHIQYFFLFKTKNNGTRELSPH